MNFGKAVYRKDNKGNPNIWYCEVHNHNTLRIHYGILGKVISNEFVNCGKRKPEAELKSRYTAKEKTGYKYLHDLTDQNILPVEELDVIDYLRKYLPDDRTTADGSMLPMLAKIYDNSNNKLFKDNISYIVQHKINGLRCFISATLNEGDMFKPIRLIFQSREGTYWTGLSYLEEYLLNELPQDLLNLMINENYILDGEIYLYGHAVNEINHLCKDPKDPKNKLLQYWCYDIAIPNMSQILREYVLDEHLGFYKKKFENKQEHIDNTDQLVVLTNFRAHTDDVAKYLRDHSIKLGFEGIIGRHPEREYQYGKRNGAMWKYKATTDGIFNIVDIVPEGDAREGIPLLILKNDINNATFKAGITGSFEYKKNILIHKDNYIRRDVIVEYGERSGVEQVPFHITNVTFVDNPAE